LDLYFTDLIVKCADMKSPSPLYRLGLLQPIELPESVNGLSKDVLDPLRYFNQVLSGSLEVIIPWFHAFIMF